jgi:shikimate kinase
MKPETQRARNIVLVGFMGAGKTTVGKRLAAKLGRTFVDMDQRIEEREGRSIAQIFAGDGEAYFRAAERDMVKALASQTGLVIAAGGGVVLDPDNLADFNRSGWVVCLAARPEVILRRVADEEQRPLLAGQKEARIREILEARRKLYEAIRNRIDTSEMGIDEVVEQVLRILPSAAREFVAPRLDAGGILRAHGGGL